MPAIGPGTYEIRIRTEEHGSRLEHRIVYVAKFTEAVYVLHAFPKTSRKTAKRDIEIAERRYAQMLRNRRAL